MGLIEFLNRNASGVFALGGVVLTLAFNWLMQRSEWANRRHLKKTDLAIEIEKCIQFDPVAEFIGSYLSLLQVTYSKGLSKDFSAAPEISDQCTMRMLAASARIKLYRDKILVEKFEGITRKRVEMSNLLFDERARNVNEAFALLGKAENIAAEILGNLKSKLLEIAV